MRGFIPLTNCRCLALLTRSSMRKSTKLAGTKDMAKITQMETSTSTEVAILPWGSGVRERRGAPRDPQARHSQGGLRELLLGEVEGVVGGCDAVERGVGARGQPCPQQRVAGHVEEGDHGVPALVVEPDLRPRGTQ